MMGHTLTPHPPLPLATPEPFGFLHIGIQVDPPQRAPFVRETKRRREAALRLTIAAEALEDRAEVVSVRVFRAHILPPLPGVPRHDFTMLIRVADPSGLDDVRKSDAFRQLGATELLGGTNAAKIGETEASRDGHFLFNHFTVDGEVDPVEAWLGLTEWYTSTIGVDNSTALRRSDSSSRFPFVNFVRLPTSPPRFLMNQLLRPSFHRDVRRTLKRNGMRALPGFYRMLR